MKFKFPSVPINPNICNMGLKPISHDSAWYGKDLAQQSCKWQIVLSSKQITELTETILRAESEGLKLFEYIKGDMNSIMGLPIKDIINYIKLYNR